MPVLETGGCIVATESGAKHNIVPQAGTPEFLPLAGRILDEENG
jgi:hypothetical protein